MPVAPASPDELQAKAAQEEVGHLEVSTGQGGDLLDGRALGLELVFHGGDCADVVDGLLQAEEVAVEGDGALQVADGEGGVVVRGNHEPLPLKELRLRVVGSSATCPSFTSRTTRR